MASAKRGTVNVDAITEKFFVRNRLNDDHVIHLATLYEAGTEIPPLLCARQDNMLIDGRHRLAALRLANKKSANVEWVEETNEQALLAMALRANIGGSLPPSNADITYAMQQLIESGMQQSVIIREFTDHWPPAVVRRYYADAQSALTKERIVKAKAAVIDEGLTVADAAEKFKLKLDTLKTAMAGTRKKRKGSAAEIKGTLTGIFRSRGGSMGQVMRRIQTQLEDGDMSWNTVNDILNHLESCATSTMQSVKDWRKRLEVRAGKTPRLNKKEKDATAA